MNKTLMIVDGNSLIFRAFHALPPLSSGGYYTNAVHGFMMMLLKALDDFPSDFCCVAFDEKAPTFRHLSYKEYKAGRPPMPEELRPQFGYVKEILTAMGLGVLSLEGYEADDILGTLASESERRGIRALVLTGDRDALQLVTEKTSLLFTKKGLSDMTLFTPEKVKSVYGVTPKQVTDWKGLMGDASDNIPGIPGVGEKTAVKLLDAYGTLENVLAHAGEIPGKLGEKVSANKAQALFSKELATILRTAPVPYEPEKWAADRLDRALPVIQKYGLNTLAGRLRKKSAAAPEAPEEARKTLSPAQWTEITTAESLKKAVSALSKSDPIALHLSKTALTIGQRDLNILVPLSPEQQSFLAGEAALDAREALAALALPDGAPLVFHDVKRHMHLWSALNLPFPSPYWDTMLAAYLLSPQEKSYALSALGEEENAHGTLKLYERQRPAIEKDGMEKLLNDVELPLVSVLFSMEKEGFRVDGDTLRDLGKTYTAEVEALTRDIIALCGAGEFNLNSPQQLGHVLFDVMGLPVRKKTSRGYSTDAQTLESLLGLHPVIEKILTYRKLNKLNSTYIEPMLQSRDGEGRIHTTFEQTSTATGRISSAAPNLQNIPVRTEAGREIRRAFTARPGWVLVDGDYSQIELRILAHMSGDKGMIAAFTAGEDIHTRTAAEINGVAPENVTGEMRAAAKAINFGIVYGISDFGLARNIGIGRREAGDYISMYLNRYPGVRAFMDGAKREGYEKGYARTLFGRRRPLSELKSKNFNLRSFGERAAMNTPIQGTAADIIKAAMVRVDKEMRRENMAGRLILQVHDELILEVPESEKAKAEALLKNVMENIIPLDVPLVCDIHTGYSWYDSK